MTVGSVGSAAASNTYQTNNQKNGKPTADELVRQMDEVILSPLAQQSSARKNSWSKQELSTTKISMKAMRKYMNLNGSSGDTSLLAMNMSRQSLGQRIEGALSQAGVKLDKNEKISISVNNKNEITVKGVKDKSKREAIEKALNEDPKLGRELRKHVANGKINEYSKKQDDYDKAMAETGMESDSDAAFDSPGMRALIMEEYLQENAGVSLSDLSLQKDDSGNYGISGANDALQALMDQDSELGATLASMLERGETASDFEATFEYANGAISDNSTIEAAKNKLQGVHAEFMALTYGYLEDMKEAGVELPEDFYNALAKGFKVEAGSNGDFEIIGLDDMDPLLRDKLKWFVNKALQQWSGVKEGEKYGGHDAFTGGINDGSFGDVVAAYVAEPGFPHGDTDEFEHKLEIDFGRGTSVGAKVVSPEADKARDEENQELANQLGQQLAGVLEQEGIDAAGLEFEVDEKGKITVLGNPEDALVQQAQQVIDDWAKNAKAAGAAENKSEADDGEKEDAITREGRKKDTAHAPDGVGKQDVVASTGDDAYKQQIWAQWRDEHFEKVKNSLPDGAHLDTDDNVIAFAKYIGWQRSMVESGNGMEVRAGVASEKVSDIRRPKYGNSYGDNTSDAKGLYLKLVDSMGQFHDGRRQSSYRFKAA